VNYPVVRDALSGIFPRPRGRGWGRRPRRTHRNPSWKSCC
jgi:hypothetical protein